jgi:hypothetical protein
VVWIFHHRVREHAPWGRAAYCPQGDGPDARRRRSRLPVTAGRGVARVGGGVRAGTGVPRTRGALGPRTRPASGRSGSPSRRAVTVRFTDNVRRGRVRQSRRFGRTVELTLEDGRTGGRRARVRGRAAHGAGGAARGPGRGQTDSLGAIATSDARGAELLRLVERRERAVSSPTPERRRFTPPRRRRESPRRRVRPRTSCHPELGWGSARVHSPGPRTGRARRAPSSTPVGWWPTCT